MLPESGSCSVAMVRMSELLPAPFGPSRPNMLLPTESDRFFSAHTPFGYVFDNPLMVSAMGIVPFSQLAGRRRAAEQSGNGIDGAIRFAAVGHSGIIIETVVVILADDLKNQAVAPRHERD